MGGLVYFWAGLLYLWTRSGLLMGGLAWFDGRSGLLLGVVWPTPGRPGLLRRMDWLASVRGREISSVAQQRRARPRARLKLPLQAADWSTHQNFAALEGLARFLARQRLRRFPTRDLGGLV